MTTQKNPRKGSPARFNGRARIVTGAAAMVALLGGWNAIGHLENSAQAAPADSAAPASLPAALPAAGQQLPAGATLDSLGIAPVKALPALPQVLAQGVPAVGTLAAAAGAGSEADPVLQLPALPTLQALPELPALPSQPPPPPAASSTRSGGS